MLPGPDQRQRPGVPLGIDTGDESRRGVVAASGSPPRAGSPGTARGVSASPWIEAPQARRRPADFHRVAAAPRRPRIRRKPHTGLRNPGQWNDIPSDHPSQSAAESADLKESLEPAQPNREGLASPRARTASPGRSDETHSSPPTPGGPHQSAPAPRGFTASWQSWASSPATGVAALRASESDYVPSTENSTCCDAAGSRSSARIVPTTLKTSTEDAQGRLPFPDPQLSFAEMIELARYDGEAARRLAALLRFRDPPAATETEAGREEEGLLRSLNSLRLEE